MDIDNPNQPNVDNTNVTVSEPVYTGSAPLPEPAKVPEGTVGKEGEEGEPAVEPVEGEAPVTPAPEGEAPVEVLPEAEPEAEVPMIDGEKLKALRETSRYKPTDMDLDIVDEFGNLDAEKFSEFMVKNNEAVFNQALTAVNANNQADRIENQAWEAVHKAYPELDKNPTLEKAIRGARIQDILSGGTGNLLELAKGVLGPIRENEIKAVESVNRTIEKQENLQVATPAVAPVERVAPTLMEQLKYALAQNDTQKANQIRHAIRKERIYGTNSKDK